MTAHIKTNHQDFWDWVFCISVGLLVTLFILGALLSMARASEIPSNLWQGLIAEDTSGDYQTYLVIASVVRNRLNAGMNNGLVALKRKNLSQFVKQNSDYILKTKGIDLTVLVTKALTEVFTNGKDYANGAVYYEHTQIYGVPRFWKNLRIVGKLYPNTKKEISLAKQ